MARLREATRFTTGDVGSTIQDLSANFARQAEAASEGLQSLASSFRDMLRSNGGAGGLLEQGIGSARSYLEDREFSEIGRDAVDFVRRHPFESILIGAGIGWIVSRRGRRPFGFGRSTTGFRSRLKDVMTRHVEVVRPDTSIREAAAKMADLDVGALPVCDGERLQGMVTDRDMAVRGAARGADPNGTAVRDVMTSTVRWAFEDEPIERAVDVMKKAKIRRLPIVDANRRLVGIVALGDLAVDADREQAGDVLERVSSPARPSR